MSKSVEKCLCEQAIVDGKVKLYAIFDKVRGWYINPFPCESDELAAALVGELFVAHDRNLLYGRENDFALYCLGSFDIYFGELVSDKRKVGDGSKLVRIYKKGLKENGNA